MIRKQPGEHRRYRYRATVSVSRPLVRRSEAGQQEERAQVEAQSMRKDQSEALAGRRVTMPREVAQPLSWAERHERYRRAQPVQRKQHRLVKRTLSQTGRPAPVGQMRVNKPLPRRGSASPIPDRGGHRRGRGFWSKFLGFLAVLAVIVGGVSFALTSSTFHIQQLTISGTQNAGVIASIRHMGIQGQNIFLLDRSALTIRLEALPLVAFASVVVQLPSSVIVNIQERVPVLLWQSGPVVFGVSQDGMVIAPLSELSHAGHLARVIDQRTHAQVHPGTRFSAQGILFVEQLFRQLPGMQGVAPFTLQYVDRIIVDRQIEPANEGNGGSYVVASANGWLAYLGDETNRNSLANRLQELQQILSIAGQQHLNLATIDLRFGRRPVYTLKS